MIEFDPEERGAIRKAIREWLAEHGPHNITAIAAGIGIPGDVRVAGVLHSMRTAGMTDRDADGLYTFVRPPKAGFATEAERIEARRARDRLRHSRKRRAQGMAARTKKAPQAKRVLGGILGPHAAERAAKATTPAETSDEWAKRPGNRIEVLPVKWASA